MGRGLVIDGDPPRALLRIEPGGGANGILETALSADGYLSRLHEQAQLQCGTQQIPLNSQKIPVERDTDTNGPLLDFFIRTQAELIQKNLLWLSTHMPPWLSRPRPDITAVSVKGIYWSLGFLQLSKEGHKVIDTISWSQPEQRYRLTPEDLLGDLIGLHVLWEEAVVEIGGGSDEVLSNCEIGGFRREKVLGKYHRLVQRALDSDEAQRQLSVLETMAAESPLTRLIYAEAVAVPEGNYTELRDFKQIWGPPSDPEVASDDSFHDWWKWWNARLTQTSVAVFLSEPYQLARSGDVSDDGSLPKVVKRAPFWRFSLRLFKRLIRPLKRFTKFILGASLASADQAEESSELAMQREENLRKRREANEQRSQRTARAKLEALRGAWLPGTDAAGARRFYYRRLLFGNMLLRQLISRVPGGLGNGKRVSENAIHEILDLARRCGDTPGENSLLYALLKLPALGDTEKQAAAKEAGVTTKTFKLLLKQTDYRMIRRGPNPESGPTLLDYAKEIETYQIQPPESNARN